MVPFACVPQRQRFSRTMAQAAMEESCCDPMVLEKVLSVARWGGLAGQTRWSQWVRSRRRRENLPVRGAAGGASGWSDQGCKCEGFRMQGRWRVDATGCSQFIFQNGHPPTQNVLGRHGFSLARLAGQVVACMGARCKVAGHGRRRVMRRRVSKGGWYR